MKNNLIYLYILTILLFFGCNEEPQIQVKNFVRQFYIHGVPYSIASEIRTDSIPTLLEMLSSDAEKSHWSKIVTTLGMIGSESAVDSLIGFFNKGPTDSISNLHFRAKINVFPALGYILNNNYNTKAYNFLRNGITFSNWDTTQFTWKASYNKSLKTRNIQLVKSSIIGLVLSGLPNAAKTLDSTKVADSTFVYNNNVDKLFVDAIEINSKIDLIGLKGYFKPK